MKCLALAVCFLFTVVSTKAQLTDTLVVRFEYNKSALTKEAISIIEQYLALQKDYTFQSAALYGHCDFIGNDAYNDSLSNERVQAVKQFLSTTTKIQIIDETGFGKRKPVNLEKTDEARALNRRVEIIIHKLAIQRDTVKAEKPLPEEEPYVPLSDLIKDSSIKVGSQLILRNLNFIGGRHVLVPQSIPVLDELLDVMEENPTLEIEIKGHVCCIGYDVDGFDFGTRTHDLSVRRAKAIYDYLINNGIAATRMRYKGFGASQKIYPLERTEREQALNRRVEIKILKK